VNVHDEPARIAELEHELRSVARRFCSAARELAPIACELANLDGRLRAAHQRAGESLPPGPEPRGLAAEILAGYVQALRPHVPFTTEASAERAELLLMKTSEEVEHG